MLNFNYTKALLLLLILFLLNNYAFPCSAYKITLNGKTMVGNNEDSWRLTSQIWFEPRTPGNYAVAHVGYSDKTHSDGAINEYGLVWDGFTAASRPIKDQSHKKKMFDYSMPDLLIRTCKTVDEVYSRLKEYNLSLLNGNTIFDGGMLFFADKSGKYLIVEADTLIMGNDPNFVLANFCVSQTKDLSSIKIPRYTKGVTFLRNKVTRTDLDFCRCLSDTMHVCREKIGDGTLYTSIYDLEAGLLHLYFYHDYKHVVSFNLEEEFKKGNHKLNMASLFPPNKEYQKLENYYTPQNNSFLNTGLLLCLILFLLSSLPLLVSFIRGRKKTAEKINGLSGMKLLLFFTNLISAYYLFALEKNQFLFYFAEPYKNMPFNALRLTAFVPLLLTLVLVYLSFTLVKFFRKSDVKLFPKYLFTLNSVLILFVLALCTYWGLIIP